MRTLCFLTIAISLAVTTKGTLAAAEPSAVVQNVAAQVYFSPQGGCTEAVVHEIQNAQHTIFVQAYSFTSNPIAKALVEAARSGVLVGVILDKSQRTEKYSGADFIAHAGIHVVIDEKPAIAHSKVMIIDGSTVITGSFNFTSSAEERNVENLLILRSVDLAKSYQQNWNERHAASVVFVAHDER